MMRLNFGYAVLAKVNRLVISAMQVSNLSKIMAKEDKSDLIKFLDEFDAWIAMT